LKPKFLPLEDYPCKLNNDGIMTWPTAFSYPEFLFSDFQQVLSEEVVMNDCLEDMFKEPLPYDPQYKYKPGNLTVYYENRKAASVHKVKLNKTIKEIISEKSFYISGGSLLFYVMPTNSDVEKEFLLELRRPMVYS